ncbi:Kelch repeat-containing protein [Hyalangium gracile]|uniref:Kelch repeat-containing protein n=1 Tax=Hyalangium gracile TaxID=394092 RepID=UPI001CCF1695|nr:kelch repeat-containing protein [Hyalangium gracile]
MRRPLPRHFFLPFAALLLSFTACGSDSNTPPDGPDNPGGPPTGERKPPTFTEVLQSATTTAPGKTVTFEVTASDPQNSALTFTWSATSGSIVERETTATRSKVDWTLTSCGGAPTVTVVVTNAYELSTSTSFAFAQLPTCAWVATGPLGTPRTGLTATALPSGKVLITGGLITRTDLEYLSSTELYDPATHSWSAAAPLSVPRYEHTATLLSSGKVLVAGGVDASSSTTVHASAELYDPATNTWSAAGSMATARQGHTATLLSSGKVLVVAGVGRATAEEYDPATNTWSPAAALTAPRDLHTATLLPSGKVLVTGGVVDTVATASAVLYDPTNRSWSPAAPMATARSGHTATLLPSGKLLVTGGSGASTLASSELYDPATNSWAPAGAMVVSRMQHAAVLLPSGKVLVAGGRSGTPVTSAELYDPAANTWTATDFMNWPRDRPIAVLSSQQALIVGGYTGKNLDYATAGELYSP